MKSPIPTIILPGLNGTGSLLGRFCELAPRTHEVTVFEIPDNPSDNYETLCDQFSERISDGEPCHLIAESFSGPLGVLLAHRHPKIVKGLTLVASFAAAPTPFVAKLVPWSILFRVPMPALVAKHYFVGSDPALIAQLQHAMRQTSPQTLARRTHCLMNVDVTVPLSQLNCELNYIRPKQDRLVPRRSLATIIRAKSTVSVREIDGPHLILQTHPREAWESILN